MAVTITERAAQHVKDFSEKRGKRSLGIRVGVKPSGCSGMAYILEFVDELQEEDIAFDAYGVKVVIDPKSFAYVDGTELDYVRDGLQEGFKFNNPNVKDACGCGESFTV